MRHQVYKDTNKTFPITRWQDDLLKKKSNIKTTKQKERKKYNTCKMSKWVQSKGVTRHKISIQKSISFLHTNNGQRKPKFKIQEYLISLNRNEVGTTLTHI